MASKSGLGTTTLWGLTPATNLLSLIDDRILLEADNAENPINILLLGQSDLRHVLKTLEEHFNFGMAKEIIINIYIIENHIEMYARQLLFIYLMQLPPEELGLHEKTKQFMELYGNTHIRPKTQRNLIKIAKELIQIVTDSDYLCKKLPFLTLSDIKFHEKDALTQIFKYWADYCDNTLENMSDRWDRRLRYHLGIRYDSRMGVFDWDYNMRLLEEGATVVNSREYKKWRATGMAFEDYDADYTQPNITLNTGASLTSIVRNICLMGEIVTGPYIAYGLECDDKEIMRKSNDVYNNAATNITSYNLEKIFTSINKHANSDNTPKDQGDNVPPPQHTMAQNLTPEISQVLAEDATVVLESVRFLLELRKEHIEAYDKKINELAAAANLIRSVDDPRSKDYHIFTKTRNVSDMISTSADQNSSADPSDTT